MQKRFLHIAQHDAVASSSQSAAAGGASLSYIPLVFGTFVRFAFAAAFARTLAHTQKFWCRHRISVMGLEVRLLV